MAALHAILDEYSPAPFTRSELERRFLELVRDAGLPSPLVNHHVAGLEVLAAMAAGGDNRASGGGWQPKRVYFTRTGCQPRQAAAANRASGGGGRGVPLPRSA